MFTVDWIIIPGLNRYINWPVQRKYMYREIIILAFYGLTFFAQVISGYT